MIVQMIALLCQINIGSMSVTIEKIEKAQLECQKYYVKCIDSKVNMFEDEKKLKECIKDKPDAQ